MAKKPRKASKAGKGAAKRAGKAGRSARRKPARKAAKRPARKAAKRPAKKPAKKAAKKPAKKPAKRPAKRSAKRPAKRPAKKAAKKPAKRPAPKAAKKAPPKPNPRAAAAKARAATSEAPAPAAPPTPIESFLPTSDDPEVGHYEQGLKAMYREKWREAIRHFQRVMEEKDQPELAERARQFLEVSHRRLEEAERQQAAADPYLLAVYEKNLGNLEVALELCKRGGRQGKDERFAYLAASIHALRGEHDDALKLLELATEMNPKNRIHAYHDPDFAALRGREEFTRLVFSG